MKPKRPVDSANLHRSFCPTQIRGGLFSPKRVKPMRRSESPLSSEVLNTSYSCVDVTDAGLSYDEIGLGETFVSKLRLTSIGIRPANGNSRERDRQMASSTLDWPIGITWERKYDAEKCFSTCPHAWHRSGVGDRRRMEFLRLLLLLDGYIRRLHSQRADRFLFFGGGMQPIRRSWAGKIDS